MTKRWVAHIWVWKNERLQKYLKYFDIHHQWLLLTPSEILCLHLCLFHIAGSCYHKNLEEPEESSCLLLNANSLDAFGSIHTHASQTLDKKLTKCLWWPHTMMIPPCSLRRGRWARAPCRTCLRWGARGPPCTRSPCSRAWGRYRPGRGQKRRTCGSRRSGSLEQTRKCELASKFKTIFPKFLPWLASTERDRVTRRTMVRYIMLQV